MAAPGLPRPVWRPPDALVIVSPVARWAKFGLAAAAFLALPGPSHAQESARVAVFSGHVVDSTGLGIGGADVALLDRRTLTSADGAFRLQGIPVGTYSVTVRHVGHSPLVVRLTVGVSDTLVHRLVLPRVVLLDSVVVTGRRPAIAEFEERRAKRAGGYFITRDQVEKYPTKQMQDVLRPLPGLRVSLGRGGRGELFAVNSRGAISLQPSSAICYVHVYIDGVPMYTGSMQQPYNLYSLSVHDLEGIEYYPSGSAIPPKFNRSAACGVLVVWTKR